MEDNSELDPRKLLYFATIVEHGSLNKAAAALGLSQPALSASMDRLETCLGVALLERGPRGVIPTAKGEMLYNHACFIREELRLAKNEIDNKPNVPDALIRIGALPSLSGSIIPVAVSRWRQKYPDIQLQIVESAQVDLMAGLTRRDFDFVVGLTEVFDIGGGLRQQVLFRDLLCVVARPEHPLVGKTDLTWTDLVHHRWVAVTSRWAHTVLGQVMTSMNVGPPQQITVCGSLSLLKSMTAAADYLALLPAHASEAERREGRLVTLPFKDPGLLRDIAVFFREGFHMDKPRRDLLATIKECALELSSKTAV